MKNKAPLLYIKIGAYFFIPIILFLLPVDFFDSGRDICLSKVLLDKSCYACGITRASMRVIHFQFAEAMQFNKLVVIIFPLLALVWIKWFFQDWNKLKSLRKN